MDTIRPRTGLVSPGLERLARDAAHGAPDPTTSAATRYLCVGAHVDPQFADRVIHDVLEERHRAVCPSRGIDLVPIVRHCLAARRRRLARDLAILAVLAASVVVSPVPTATLTLTAWSGWWLHRLARQLSRRAFDPGRAPATASPAVQWRLEDLAREQYGHATVYSSFVPFVGSGVPFSTWSLVLDLQRPSRRRLIDGPAPSPRISVVDLQARVVAQLGHLAGERLDGGERLTSLQLERHVFVDGSSFRGSRTRPAEGPTGPQLHSGGTDVERLADEQAGPARQYLDVRIGSWEEELVVTVHLQFASIGRTLYMEAVSCVLPPINAAYHVVDAMPSRMTPGALLDLVVTTTRTFASAFCRAPARAGRALLAPIRRWLDQETTLAAIREDLPFDYGARTSVRELGAAPGCHSYFQRLDVEKYRKLVDLHVLQAIGDHLEDEGVDIAAFARQRMRILERGLHLEPAT